MVNFSSGKVRYFSIRKNISGATLYDIKVKMKSSLDQQIGSVNEQFVGKDSSFGIRTDDGGGEFKCTIRASGDGSGGYIKISTLKSLLAYKGQLVLLSLSDLDYNGSYIVTNAKYNHIKAKVYNNGKVKSSDKVDVDVTFQKVPNQPVTYPSNNSSKTPSAVKQNNSNGKKSIKDLSAEYQSYYNKCPTLSFDKYKGKKNVKCVTLTQKLLRKNNLYLKCKVDGWFHTCTRSNVIKFKKKKGIKPYNSVVNKKVRLALLKGAFNLK